MTNRIFLLFCSVGLVPIALGYGGHAIVIVCRSCFGIPVDSVNLTHILRAVMGTLPGHGRAVGVGRIQQSTGETGPSQLCRVHARTGCRTDLEFHSGRFPALAPCGLCGPWKSCLVWPQYTCSGQAVSRRLRINTWGTIPAVSRSFRKRI